MNEIKNGNYFTGRQNRFLFQIHSVKLDIPDWYIRKVDFDEKDKSIFIRVADIIQTEVGAQSVPTKLKNYNTIGSFSCSYIILDETGSEIYRIKFTDCYIEGYKYGGSDYKNDDVRQYTIKITYNDTEVYDTYIDDLRAGEPYKPISTETPKKRIKYFYLRELDYLPEDLEHCPLKLSKSMLESYCESKEFDVFDNIYEAIVASKKIREARGMKSIDYRDVAAYYEDKLITNKN